MGTKEKAPTRTANSDQGATKGSSTKSNIITNETISQIVLLLAEVSRYAVVKYAAIALILLAPVMTKAEEVQIIQIDIVPPAVTEAPKMPVQPMQTYDWDTDLIDALASIYWAETGSDAKASTEKLMITQLIFNRSQHGSPFPEDLLSVCRQRNEFNKGKISDRNRTVARENLDKVQSQIDGWYQGIPAAMTKALYMGRVGSTLKFYDSSWTCIYEVKA